MERYEDLELEVIGFEAEDVIAQSGGGSSGNPIEMPDLG